MWNFDYNKLLASYVVLILGLSKLIVSLVSIQVEYLSVIVRQLQWTTTHDHDMYMM